mmetsp:Transcript_26026/g.63145  ORF Transcript_26026/g.63145 Transcript_26026/m.63145 type:complete len:294 (-) Transcript_26026:7-888(-)
MAPAIASSPGTVWSFGFGSNMNVDFVNNKKGLKVLDHSPASLKGWRMGFNLAGFDRVEPAFANAMQGDPSDEIHGVAIKLSLEDGEKMDRMEGGYAKKNVVVTAYDGREIKAYLYTREKEDKTEYLPSKRYLDVLVSGAKAAGLDEHYTARLARLPTYAPTPETLALRKTLPSPQSLPPITVADLAGKPREGDYGYVAVLGYVFQVPRSKVIFRSHLGRDLTARASRQYRGISLDDNDDMGRPPFRLASQMDSPEEVEYVWQWLDHYIGKTKMPEGVVGYVSEYRKQEAEEVK